MLLTLAEVGATVGTNLCASRVARPTKSAVNICPGFGTFDLGLIDEQLSVLGLLEFHIGWLGSSTAIACLPRSGITTAAIGAGPF
jgi:hypothetical protein